MTPDLKLEVIYFNTLTDFKLEFKICGIGNVRFLSAVVSSERAFLLALQRSVGRSRVVVTVGGLSPEENILTSLSRAIGVEMVKAQNKDIANAEEIEIPKGSIPLFSKEGKFQGVVIEQGEQSIIMLSEDRELTHEALDSLILPYLKLVMAKKNMPLTTIADELSNNRVESADENPEELIEEEQEEIVATEETEDEKPDTQVEGEETKETIESEEAALATEEQTTVESECLEESEGPANTNSEDFSVSEEIIEEIKEEPTLLEKTDELEEAEAEESFINIEDVIKTTADDSTSTSTKTEQEIDDMLRNIVLKKIDISEVEMGSHDKFINPDDEALFVEEELYVGKHSKKEVEAEPLNIKNQSVEDTDSKDAQKGYIVDELPNDITDDNLLPDLRKSHGHKILKAIVAVILVILVIIGSFFGYRYFYQPSQGETIYQSILALYGQDSPAIDNTNIMREFGKLYELNNQVAGFISVPNSEIGYPVVQTTSTGAMYYQTHLFDGTFNGYGTPYTLNSLNSNGFNRNITIYGNTVNSGKMFSDLSKYTNLQFYRNSPVISFNTLYKKQSYKVFGVVQFESTTFDYAKNTFFNDQEFLEYLTVIQKASVVNTSVDLLGGDSILTLVTEKNGLTTCVFARLVRMGESSSVDVNNSSVNQTPEKLDSQNTSSSFIIDDPEIIDQNNVSGGRHEEDIPDSSVVDITASEFVSTSSFYVSSTISSNLISSNLSSNVSSNISSASSILSSTQPVETLLPTLYVTNDTAGGTRVSGSTLEILASVVEAEMGSGYEIEALKAQAVCKYSWLLCEGATDKNKYPHVAMKTPSSKTISAVKEVLGVVVRYNGKVAQTFCYAFSAGKTANATDLWGGSYPWVRAVDSSVDKNASKFQTTNTYAASDIAKWVKGAAGPLKQDIDLTKISDKNSWLVPEYDSNNLYVTWINIGGVKIRGSWLRTYVLTSANCGSGKGLRSPAYTITYNAETDSFTFVVKGYGHGAGLSQFGANQYAKNGWTYEQILKHYFTGIDLGISYGK